MNNVQHIAFNCSDMKQQEDFYARHFGFKRARVFNAGELMQGYADEERAES